MWVRRDAAISQQMTLTYEERTAKRRANPMPDLPADDDFKVVSGSKRVNRVQVRCPE